MITDSKISRGRSHRAVIEVLYDGESFQEFRAPRLETGNDHGTGCTFASAIAAELAKEHDVPETVHIAKDYSRPGLTTLRELANRARSDEPRGTADPRQSLNYRGIGKL